MKITNNLELLCLTVIGRRLCSYFPNPMTISRCPNHINSFIMYVLSNQNLSMFIHIWTNSGYKKYSFIMYVLGMFYLTRIACMSKKILYLNWKRVSMLVFKLIYTQTKNAYDFIPILNKSMIDTQFENWNDFVLTLNPSMDLNCVL